jgi:predicted hotdog family 3-hydroxylacyl-ACP dehydratase
MMNPPPTQLSHAEIALRIPHSGNMCLLDHVQAFTAQDIEALACDHTQADHPLREGGVLLSPCLIEYAAQAMALHGALLAAPEKTPGRSQVFSSPSGGLTQSDRFGGTRVSKPVPGFIASVRQVQFQTPDLDSAAAPLHIHAQRLAGSEHEVLYAFTVCDAHQTLLAKGRAAVVLKPQWAATA